MQELSRTLLALSLEGLGTTVNVLELRIPIWVRAPRQGLPVRLETVTQVMEQTIDRPLTD